MASRKKPMGKIESRILKSLEKSIKNDRLRKDTDKFINIFKNIQKSRKQAGGKVMVGKTSKYKAKGGMVKRMGGGKTSKYRAKGGLVKKKAGKVVLSGMAARRNARRGNM